VRETSGAVTDFKVISYLRAESESFFIVNE